MYMSNRESIFFLFSQILLSILVFTSYLIICQASTRQALSGVATGKVLLEGEPWGTGTVTFDNVGGDISFVVTCEKDISAGANSSTCVGTNVNGWFSGGPNGYAVFGSGSNIINLQLVDGKKFTYSQGGVTAELEVKDPTIFNNWDKPDDEEDSYESEEYDPSKPLTDSNVRAVDIDGQVEIACPPDFESWDVLKVNTVIYNHCRLKTGEQSTLRVSFGNMSSFVMKPESEIVINQATKEKSNFQLLFGKVWTNIKKMTKGEEFGFKGSQAVAGIKGTTFILQDDGKNTLLKVIEGDVNLKSLSTSEVKRVTTGETITATSNGFNELQKFDITIENTNWKTGIDNSLENSVPESSQVQSGNPKSILNNNIYYMFAAVIISFIFVVNIYKRNKNNKNKYKRNT
jgi:hypothetical protein